MADLRYECYTNEHYLYTFILVIPTLVLWGLIVPIILFKSLYKKRNILNSIYTRMSLGFLYQDYKS